MKNNIFLGVLFAAFVFIFIPLNADAQEIKGAKDYFLHGDKRSATKVVTYTDFECPFCNRFHSTLESLIEKYKDEDISFSYRSFPLTQIHPDAFDAAVALECLNQVGGNKKNFEFSSIIFDQLHVKRNFETDEIAKLTKVNKDKFSKCMYNKNVRKQIENIVNEYTNKIAETDRLFGTPYTVVSKGSRKVVIPGAQSFEVADNLISDFLINKNKSKRVIDNDELRSKDDETKSILANLRANAELYFDDNNSYKKLCSEIKKFINDYDYDVKISCRDSSNKYAIESKLRLNNKYYCVDSTGYAGASSKSKGRSALMCNK